MTPDQMRDASLLDLFRLEAEAQKHVLDTGLLILERDPANASQLEACMRAAHSLKGAARIVGLDHGVQIAHAMEDLLVAAHADAKQKVEATMAEEMQKATAGMNIPGGLGGLGGLKLPF